MSDKIPAKHANFVKHETFWCNDCDMNQVDSDNPDTGKFFCQHGHTWNHESQKTTDEYQMVVFAICTVCLLK